MLTQEIKGRTTNIFNTQKYFATGAETKATIRAMKATTELSLEEIAQCCNISRKLEKDAPGEGITRELYEAFCNRVQRTINGQFPGS